MRAILYIYGLFVCHHVHVICKSCTLVSYPVLVIIDHTAGHVVVLRILHGHFMFMLGFMTSVLLSCPYANSNCLRR